MKVYLVMSCWIDMTDPEPNVTVQGIFSTKLKAEVHMKALVDEEGGSWFGIRECEVDDPRSGVSLDKDDVDMELFY